MVGSYHWSGWRFQKQGRGHSLSEGSGTTRAVSSRDWSGLVGDAEIKDRENKAPCPFESQRMESRAVHGRVHSLFFGKVLFSQTHPLEGHKARSHQASLWSSPVAPPVTSCLHSRFSLSVLLKDTFPYSPVVLREDIINKRERFIKVAGGGPTRFPLYCYRRG